MKLAVIDIGSNTVKISVFDAEETPGARLKKIADKTAPLGLIGYVENGAMRREGVELLLSTLRGYKKLAEENGCDEIYAFATASLRGCSNKKEIAGRIRDEFGFSCDLVDGAREALLSFKGLKYSLGGDAGNGMMIDMGGGSTELLRFLDGEVADKVSLPFGCLSLQKEFVNNLFPSSHEIHRIGRAIYAEASRYNWVKNAGGTLYLVGGTARSAAKLHAALFGASKEADNDTMSPQDMTRLIAAFTPAGKKEIQLLSKLVPSRIHTIIPGMAAYAALITLTGAQRLVVSSAGIREGYARAVLAAKQND